MRLQDGRREQWRNLALALLAYLIGVLVIYATQRWQFVLLVWMLSQAVAFPILWRVLRGFDWHLTRTGSTLSISVTRTDSNIGWPHVVHLGLLGLINLTTLAVLVGEGDTPRLRVYAVLIIGLVIVRLLGPLQSALLRRSDAAGR
jgi:hypothetical protein